MSKTVTFTADVYPYCLGDVVVLDADELKRVDQIAKVRKTKVYEDHAVSEVPSTDEADRQAADRAKADAKAAKEAEAERKLADAEAAKADAAAHNSASGKTVPGTSAGKTVTTAA